MLIVYAIILIAWIRLIYFRLYFITVLLILGQNSSVGKIELPVAGFSNRWLTLSLTSDNQWQDNLGRKRGSYWLSLVNDSDNY